MLYILTGINEENAWLNSSTSYIIISEFAQSKLTMWFIIACCMTFLIKLIKVDEMMDEQSNCITQININECAISFSRHLSLSYIPLSYLSSLSLCDPLLEKKKPSFIPSAVICFSAFPLLKSPFVSLECFAVICSGRIIPPVSHISNRFRFFFFSPQCLVSQQNMDVSLSLLLQLIALQRN